MSTSVSYNDCRYVDIFVTVVTPQKSLESDYKTFSFNLIGTQFGPYGNTLTFFFNNDFTESYLNGVFKRPFIRIKEIDEGTKYLEIQQISYVMKLTNKIREQLRHGMIVSDNQRDFMLRRLMFKVVHT